MDLKNCYKILEIQETASLAEIKQAYRDMIGIWHPDRYVQNPRLHDKATEKLKVLNLAYNALVTRLESGVVKRDAGPEVSGNNAHVIIVTCPGCQKKNRIKAGYVTRHPRCGACKVLLFQKTKNRKTDNQTKQATDVHSSGAEATENTFHSKAVFQETPAAQNPFPERKARFWNKWTILLSLACMGLVIANTHDMRQMLANGLDQVSAGRYGHFFQNAFKTAQTKKNASTASADILQIQQSLKTFGYAADPLDGIWGEQTLAAVQQFRNDFFLDFRMDDVPEIRRALQRQRAIIKIHPDWPRIATDDRFKFWTEQQVMTSPKICRKLLATGEVQQVGSLIDWYKFDRLKPKPVSLPPSGTIKKTYHKGLAPLTIQARNDGRHYYLKLRNASSGLETLTAFIRSGSTYVEHIPLGKYQLKYAVGDAWYGTRWFFGPKTVFRKIDQLLEFKIQTNKVAGYRLDLYLKPSLLEDTDKEYAFDF